MSPIASFTTTSRILLSDYYLKHLFHDNNWNYHIRHINFQLRDVYTDFLVFLFLNDNLSYNFCQCKVIFENDII